MSVFGLAKSQPAEQAQKGHVLVRPPEHFTVVYTLCFYTGDTVSSLTPPPMKKPRIDAAESKIMKISDLPDLESGVKIWRKALEDAKSNEVGYKSRIEFLEQKIEKLESKVDELRLPEHKILDLYQQKIKELESKVNIILAKNIVTLK